MSGAPPPPPSSWLPSVAMAANREQQVGHMTSFPPAVYPFAFNPMRSRSPFDLLANGSLFGRFGADLPKEMAALCEYYSMMIPPARLSCPVTPICSLVYARGHPPPFWSRIHKGMHYAL